MKGAWLTFTFDLIIGLLFVSGISMASLGLYARKFVDRVPAAVPFILLMFCGAAWSVLYALDLLTASLPLRVFYHNLRFLFLPFFAVIELWLVLAYVHKTEWMHRDWAAVLLVIPVASALLAITSPYHTLFQYDFSLNTAGPVPVLQYSESTFFVLYFVYSFVLLALAVVLLVVETHKKGTLMEVPTILLLAALAFPTALSYLSQIFLIPFPGINLAPALLWFPAILYAVALFRFQFLDIVPIARSRLIEALSKPVLVLDKDLRVIDMNPAAGLLFSIPPSSALGKSIDTIVPDWPDFLSLCRGDTVQKQELARARNGITHYYRGSAEPLLTPQGDTEGHLIFLQEVTDLKQTEQALRESEKRYRDLFEINNAVMLIINPETGRIVDANTAACRYYGYSKEEFADIAITDINIADPKTIYQNMAHAASDGGKAFSFRHKKKNGEIRDVEVFSAPVELDGHRLLHSIIQDVTERKRAEDALREKTGELDQYFSTSLDLFCIADTDGNFRRLNTQWEKSLGYTIAELEGQRFLDFVHPDDMQATLDAISDLASQKEVLNFTNRYRHRDGTYRWIEWRSFPKGDRIFAAARDITERKQVEEALSESEEKYRTLVESSFDGIAIHQGGILVYVNQTAARILGAPDPGVFIGVPAIDIVAPAFRQRIAERVKLAPGNALGLIREQFVRRDGSLIDVDVTTSPSTWKGRPAAYVTFRDITAQARAENALRESEEKYRTIIDDMQDIFYRTDPEGKITMLSPSAARLAGYDSNDQLIGQDVISVYVDPAGRGRLLDTLREKGSVYAYPLILRTRDGTSKHVTTSSHFYRDSHGNIQGVEGVIHDISDRKQAEDALRRSEERYRTIIENIQDVYFRFDREGRIIMVSPSAAPTFGFANADEMLGGSVASIWKNPAEREQMIDAMRARGGAVQDWETEFVKKDGTAFWASVSGCLHTDERGEFDGTEGIIRDISERKKMEEALKSTLTKLNMLSSITRHDILNQIMGLRTFLELSREDLKGTRFAEFIEKEDQAAEAIQRQIEFTKFYQDIGVNAPKWQDVKAVIHSAVAQLNPAAVGVKVTVTGMEIFADLLIEKVFYNLMENSLRHGERVTTMEFSSRELEAGLVITYCDNGVGITLEDKQKLFQRGFGKHTGLGLFLSREILAITGITITENGEPGAGVRFEITVPKDAYRYTS